MWLYGVTWGFVRSDRSLEDGILGGVDISGRVVLEVIVIYFRAVAVGVNFMVVVGVSFMVVVGVSRMVVVGDSFMVVEVGVKVVFMVSGISLVS